MTDYSLEELQAEAARRGLSMGATSSAPMATPTPDYGALSVDQLQAEARRRGLMPAADDGFLSGLVQGVKDAPEALMSMPGAMWDEARNLVGSVTSPRQAISDGSAERGARFVGNTAAGLAGASALGSSGAMLGSALGPLGTAAGGILGGAVGFGLGSLGFSKANQAAGNDAPTTMSQDLTRLGYDVGQGAATGAVTAGVGKGVGKVTRGIESGAAKAGQQLKNSAIGARSTDFTRSIKKNGVMVDADGATSSRLQQAINELDGEGFFSGPKDPGSLIQKGKKLQEQVGGQVGSLVAEADRALQASGEVVIPKLTYAEEYVAKVKDPIRKRALQDGLEEWRGLLNQDLDGTLTNVQQMKSAIAREGFASDARGAAMNELRRPISGDLRRTVEAYTDKALGEGMGAEVKGLNRRWGNVEDLTDRVLLREAGLDSTADPVKAGIGMLRTSGGIGSFLGPSLITGNPILGALAGGAYLYATSRGGRMNLSRAMPTVGKAAGKVAGAAEAIQGAAPMAGAFLEQDDGSGRRGLSTGLPAKGPTPQAGYKPMSAPMPKLSRDQVLSLRPVAGLNEPMQDLVLAVIDAESSYDTDAVSPAGAQGLMQLMPAMQRAFEVSDPFDPEQNTEAGIRLLREELKRFGDTRLALASYNAGSPRVRQAIKKAGTRDWNEVKKHLPKETQKYPDRVLRRTQKKNPLVEA